MVTLIALLITAWLLHLAVKWCRNHHFDEGFSD